MVTIKDIAKETNFSVAVVSRALNPKPDQKVKATTEKTIKAVAERLGYRPNRLARAMISGVSPIVALSLHTERVSSAVINFYLHDIMPGVAFALNKAGFEMLFLPFTTHEEQYRRLDELISERLIGGVISNFIPRSQAKVVNFLKNKKLPFVLLGDKVDSSVPSVYIDQREIAKILKNYARRKRFDGEVVHLMFNPAIANQLMILDENDWQQCSAKDEELFRKHSGILFTVPDITAKLYLIEHKKVTPANILLIHDERIPISSKPALLVKSVNWERAEKASGLIAEWMTSGTMPSQKQWSLRVDKQHLKFIE